MRSGQGISLHHQFPHIQRRRGSDLTTDFEHTIIVIGIALRFRRRHRHQRPTVQPCRLIAAAKARAASPIALSLVLLAPRTRLLFQIGNEIVCCAERKVFARCIFIQIKTIITRRKTGVVGPTLVVNCRRRGPYRQVLSKYRRARAHGLRRAPRNGAGHFRSLRSKQEFRINSFRP